MDEAGMEKSWFVYMVECADGSLYTGITTDVVARVAKHNTGKGAKYTRSRLPVKLVWQEAQIEKNVALKKEVALKKMTRLQKQAFLKSNSSK